MYTSENIICKACHSFECYLSEIDGYQGLCDACASWLMSIELEAQWDLELAIYNERSGNSFDDYNNFYYACYDGDIDKKHLEGLVELNKALLDAESIRLHNEQSTQSVFDLDNELPF